MTDVRERIAGIVRDHAFDTLACASRGDADMPLAVLAADRILACVREGEEPRAWEVWWEDGHLYAYTISRESSDWERRVEYARSILHARLVPLYAAPAPRGESGE